MLTWTELDAIHLCLFSLFSCHIFMKNWLWDGVIYGRKFDGPKNMSNLHIWLYSLLIQTSKHSDKNRWGCYWFINEGREERKSDHSFLRNMGKKSPFYPVQRYSPAVNKFCTIRMQLRNFIYSEWFNPNLNTNTAILFIRIYFKTIYGARIELQFFQVSQGVII